jgi:hypothetical protein
MAAHISQDNISMAWTQQQQLHFQEAWQQHMWLLRLAELIRQLL